MGRSSLYHFFPGGKEEMVTVVLDRAERTIREDLIPALSAPDEPQRQVGNFVAKLAEYYEGGTIGCLFSTLTLHDCPSAVSARVAELTEQFITAIAVYLQSRGVYHATATAEKAVRLIEGGLVVALATRRPQRFETALEDLTTLLAQT